MFFLSKGSLKKCRSRVSYFDQAKSSLPALHDSNHKSHQDRRTRFENSTKLRLSARDSFLVRIDELCVTQSAENPDENASTTSMTMMMDFFAISDGQDKAVAAVEKSSYSHILGNQDNLERGSIVLVDEYSLVSLSNELKDHAQLADFLALHSFVLDAHSNGATALEATKISLIRFESFRLIGVDRSVCGPIDINTGLANSHSSDIAQTLKCENNESDSRAKTSLIDCNFVRIADLKKNMPHDDWAIRCLLREMTAERAFENRQNGNKGTIMRAQFEDESGLIEAVFFNEACTKWKHVLKKNHCYIVRRAQVKYIKKNLRAWCSSKYSNYDLIVDSLSIFVEDEQAHEQLTNLLSIDTSSSSALLSSPQRKEESAGLNGEASTLSNLADNQPKSTFIKLHQASQNRNGSSIDVIAIVTKVNDLTCLKRTGKPSLPLRRIEIVDETSPPIEVALWGAQAKDCMFKVGKTYMFKGIQLTNYNGLSLSVVRATGCMDITGYFNVSGVEKLSMWWRQHKSELKEEDQEISIEPSAKKSRL